MLLSLRNVANVFPRHSSSPLSVLAAGGFHLPLSHLGRTQEVGTRRKTLGNYKLSLPHSHHRMTSMHSEDVVVSSHRCEEFPTPAPPPPPTTIAGAAVDASSHAIVTGCAGSTSVRAGRYRNDPYRATVLPQLFHSPDHHDHLPAAGGSALSTPRSNAQEAVISSDEGPNHQPIYHRHRPLPPVQPAGHPEGRRRGGGAGGGFASRVKHDIAQAATFDRVYGSGALDGDATITAPQELHRNNPNDFSPYPLTLPHAAAPSRNRERTLFALVRLKHDSQMYIASFPLRSGDYVVVEADRGTNIGMVERVSAQPPPYRVVSRAVRVATPSEVLELAALRLEEQAVVAHVEHCAQSVLHLPMDIIDVEFQFDRNKLTIYFRSTNAVVDFRKLQRTLFKRYGCRIWLVAEQRLQGSAGE